jgi:hypothetical protein
MDDIDTWHTPYGATLPQPSCLRETDDPPPGRTRTNRQQLARALRWHRFLNGWSQEALGLAAGLDR